MPFGCRRFNYNKKLYTKVKGGNALDKQNKNTDKLTDKAFSRMMLTSVLGILVCLVCLCSATWAWFTADVASSNNTLMSGSFDLEVSVNDVKLERSTDRANVHTFEKAGLYTVTLKMTEDTTVTKGYCVITVNGKPYKTASINNVDGTNPFKFMLDVEEDGMTVKFTSAWGIPIPEEVSVGIEETLTIGEIQGTNISN